MLEHPRQARRVLSRSHAVLCEKLFRSVLFANRGYSLVSSKTKKMWKFVFLSTVVAVVSAEQKVPVSVYYETLCPDSITFVTKQLYPAYNSGLKNRMDLNLVPYGKASHQRSPDGQKWEFKCHHGPVECYGNKVHGCILKQVRDRDDQVKYINCLMNQSKTTKNEYPLGGCISGADLSTVTTCANGTHEEPNGADILAENGEETARLNPALTSVPTVVFNRVYNKTEQELAQSDFKKVLCSYLKDECKICDCSSAATASLSALAAIFSATLLRLL